MHALIKYPN